MLENIYLDNPDEEPITIEYAIQYCYDYFNEFQQDYLTPKTQVRFDGKQNIINEIRSLILTSDIKIK